MKTFDNSHRFNVSIEVFDHVIRRKLCDDIAFHTPDNPYVIIYDFFWDGNLFNAYHNLNNLITCALDNKKSGTARDMAGHIYLLEHLTSLLDGAYQLYKNEPPEGPESPTPNDVKKGCKHLYKKITTFTHQPCFLTMQEWVQPRLVFRQFFEHSTLALWKLTLHRLVQSVLPSASAAENMPWQKDVFAACIQLHRLVEACWLIRLTEIPEWKEDDMDE